jgi:Fe-S-cluster containining protein
MTDHIKKPVHKALIPYSHIEKLEASGKLPKSYVSTAATHATLPVEPKPEKKSFSIPKVKGASSIKQDKLRTRLQIIYDRIPPFKEEDKPPCNTCKAAPCCKAYLVDLTKEEHESGVYGDYSIEMTPEIKDQLRYSWALVVPMMTMAPALNSKGTSYYLEGKVGDPCPFLQEDNSCGIYEDRPFTCRAYTCVGDPRITDEMRAGIEPVFGEKE